MPTRDAGGPRPTARGRRARPQHARRLARWRRSRALRESAPETRDRRAHDAGRPGVRARGAAGRGARVRAQGGRRRGAARGGPASRRAGETYLNPRLGARLAAAPPAPSGPPDDLTERELEVLRLIALGHTNVEIGEQLYLSRRARSRPTARTSSRRRGASTRAELVRYAIDHGLIQHLTQSFLRVSPDGLAVGSRRMERGCRRSASIRGVEVPDQGGVMRRSLQVRRHRRQHRADRVRHRRDLHGHRRPRPRPLRPRPRADRRHAGLDHPRPAGRHRQRGAGVRQGDAQAHARGDRRQDLRADAPLPRRERQGAPNDEKAAAKDRRRASRSPTRRATCGSPRPRCSTALNTAYFAESVATFAIVMGVALLLSGVGFLILTLRVLREPGAASPRRPGSAARAQGGGRRLAARSSGGLGLRARRDTPPAAPPRP